MYIIKRFTQSEALNKNLHLIAHKIKYFIYILTVVGQAWHFVLASEFAF